MIKIHYYNELNLYNLKIYLYYTLIVDKNG